MKVLSFDVGIINLAYCIFDTACSKITHWEVITLTSETNYNKLYINLITQLDQRKHLIDDIEIVLIEKQPSFNPKMRIIAGCLQTYFIIRGIVDSHHPNIIKSVEFFSPKHKLKCYSGPELVIESKCKSKYSKTKKMGVLICREKLHEYHETEMVTLFEQSKKKDDLADCYLQAITYCIFKKVLKLNTNLPTVPVPIPEKSPSKVLIKKQIKEYLDSHVIPGKYSQVELMNLKNDTTVHPLLVIFNDIGSNIKDNIVSKYLVCFPLNYNSMVELFDLIGIKSYLNKIIT